MYPRRWPHTGRIASNIMCPPVRGCGRQWHPVAREHACMPNENLCIARGLSINMRTTSAYETAQLDSAHILRRCSLKYRMHTEPCVSALCERVPSWRRTHDRKECPMRDARAVRKLESPAPAAAAARARSSDGADRKKRCCPPGCPDALASHRARSARRCLCRVVASVSRAYSHALAPAGCYANMFWNMQLFGQPVLEDGSESAASVDVGRSVGHGIREQICGTDLDAANSIIPAADYVRGVFQLNYNHNIQLTMSLRDVRRPP